jgi:hypothetical protein
MIPSWSMCILTNPLFKMIIGTDLSLQGIVFYFPFLGLWASALILEGETPIFFLKRRLK